MRVVIRWHVGPLVRINLKFDVRMSSPFPSVKPVGILTKPGACSRTRVLAPHIGVRCLAWPTDVEENPSEALLDVTRADASAQTEPDFHRVTETCSCVMKLLVVVVCHSLVWIIEVRAVAHCVRNETRDPTVFKDPGFPAGEGVHLKVTINYRCTRWHGGNSPPL